MNDPRGSNGPATNPIPEHLARRVRLVIFDVDGVLTDGGIYIGQRAGGGAPVELKRFLAQDGLGMKMLAWAGLEVVAISGRESPATDLRMAELGIACHQVPGAYKLPVARRILERSRIGWSETAMLADDLPDVSVFRKAGLRAAVRNAYPPVSDMAHWRSRLAGGKGAAREFTDALLAARGELDAVAKRYVAERS